VRLRVIRADNKGKKSHLKVLQTIVGFFKSANYA